MTTTTAPNPNQTPTMGQMMLGPLGKAPAWARWMIYSALGVLLLTIVSEFDDTNRLTAPSASQAMLRWAVPIMLAGLGGLFAERAGVINIGLEGMMIFGTWFGAWGAINYGPWAGLLIGAAGGALGGLIHAIVTVSFGVDHIISGVAINLLAPGVTRFLSSEIFEGYEGGSITKSPRVPSVGKVTVPGVSDALNWITEKEWFWISDMSGLLEGMVTDLSYFTILAYSIVPITAWVVWRTRFGLRLRISGEHPGAGEAQGISIYTYKYIGVIISGALAGLGGAFIVSSELSGTYLEGQTTGRGFIGLAALIFGNWRPVGVMAGALLFAYPFGVGLRDRDGSASHALLLVMAVAMAGVAVWAWQRRNSTDVILASIFGGAALTWYLMSDTMPDWWINILPYVIVLIVLVFFSQRLRPPAAAGMIYRKGET